MGYTSYHDALTAAEEAGETFKVAYDPAKTMNATYGASAEPDRVGLEKKKRYASAAQDWLLTIPIMQQSVLFSGIRGMDGLRKLHPAKAFVRFYRRCVLLSAFEAAPILDPWSPGGGDFTGPSINKNSDNTGYVYYHDNVHPGQRHDAWAMDRNPWELMAGPVLNDFIRARDEMPLHYFSHMMHAFQIVGYHHPNETIRRLFHLAYTRMAHALHLWPEYDFQMDERLGDTEAGWRAREDCAGSCST